MTKKGGSDIMHDIVLLGKNLGVQVRAVRDFVYLTGGMTDLFQAFIHILIITTFI